MKQIKGYDGQYWVSADGRVWSEPQVVLGRNNSLRNMKGKFLKQFIQNNGYYFVQLYKNGKRKNHLVSRLVGEAFCIKPEGCNVINHIDIDRLNNHYTNLEWTTASGNVGHSVALGNYKGQAFSRELYDKAMELLPIWEGKQYELAEYLGISPASLSRIKNGSTYKFYS